MFNFLIPHHSTIVTILTIYNFDNSSSLMSLAETMTIKVKGERIVTDYFNSSSLMMEQ